MKYHEDPLARSIHTYCVNACLLVHSYTRLPVTRLHIDYQPKCPLLKFARLFVSVRDSRESS